MPRGNISKTTASTWLATLALLCMFGLAVTSLKQKSPTFDEQGFLVRGLAYVRNENRHMRVGHPLGLNALNAAFLVNDSSVSLPTNDPSWSQPSFHRPAELFLWGIGNDVAHIMFLGRLPTVFISLFLAAITFRWTIDATGKRWFALIALLFVAFDPNILAHSRLTTTDAGITAGAMLAGYTLWRYLSNPTTVNILFAGLGFGLLNNTKFTAGLYVPLFAITIVFSWFQQCRNKGIAKSLPDIAKFIVLFPLSSFIVLWAAYGFDIGVMPDQLPSLPQLSGQTLPLAHHLEQLLDIGKRSTRGSAAFLLGDYSRDGWWYYFPITFALKTPIPTLVLIGLGLTTAWYFGRNHQNKQRHQLTIIALLLPSLGFLAIGMTTSVNLGYRHIMPILPFLIVFGCYILSLWPAGITFGLTSLIACILVFNTLTISPDYLAFFNQFAGGPDQGWRSLVDSNLDWGQDLSGLAKWVQDENVDEIWLSYFGEARPDYYNIPYRGLDSVPPRLTVPGRNPFYPTTPAPGLYAISATNLQGVLFDDHDQFAWFREREPLTKIGHSIFIYEVEASGEPLALLLGETSLQAISSVVYRQLGTNDIRPIWSNPATSTVYPIGNSLQIEQAGDLWGNAEVASLVSFKDSRSLGPWGLDVEGISAEHNDNTLTATTTWQVITPTNAALRIFIHALDENDNILGQSDVLDVHTNTLITDDIIEQAHTISNIIAPSALRIGLYDWKTGTRFGEPIIIPFLKNAP